jgi:DNA-binding transcriptional regulator GbsR (MarR family)
MSKQNPTEAQSRFMDEVASLTAPWGWPRHVARMFAYLLLSDEPKSLDQLADDLCISKSNASVAARTLEERGNALRHSEPGSKRVYYSAPRNLFSPFAAQAETLVRLMRMFERARAQGQPGIVGDRLDRMSDFCVQMREAMLGVIEASDGVS